MLGFGCFGGGFGAGGLLGVGVACIIASVAEVAPFIAKKEQKKVFLKKLVKQKMNLSGCDFLTHL